MYGRFLLVLTVVAIAAFAFAFLYEPRRGRMSRLYNIGRRVRVIAYAYVLAILVSAAMRLVFGWGT